MAWHYDLHCCWPPKNLQLLVVHFEHHIRYILAISYHSKGIDAQLLQTLDLTVTFHLSVWFCILNSPTFLSHSLFGFFLKKKIIVEAIVDIKKMYNVTRNWQGDPCFPSEYLWDGLNCNDNHHPRIISL